MLIVIFNLLWSEFDETNEMFRSASTDLDHAFVVCDLTQVTDNKCVIRRKKVKQNIISVKMS